MGKGLLNSHVSDFPKSYFYYQIFKSSTYYPESMEETPLKKFKNLEEKKFNLGQKNKKIKNLGLLKIAFT
jgi:hypothetical protein